ncbi:(d)CMP kinase [Candidatus Pelagibacter communis]|uniref:(d)CMP kinase n=1 Tax=Pelagibacter ubique TaxID=198252 RepID=UPI00094C8B59|nr:(d)CMP kinase [Candidatus Pelagibacter ubique]|tara:strand:+ start:2488 stop:3129 length:642 start_codon:yes stop_codon:yes gene_type:complete
MVKIKKLIIACDGESASGKSTAAKLVSNKYKLLLINSGLLYRYCSKLVLTNKPKNLLAFLKKRFSNITYKSISNKNLHSEEISNHVAVLAKNKKVREIVNKFQLKIIKENNKICVEGRDIASKILSKKPKYDVAFYFKCNLKVASYRRWLDLKKTISLDDVKKSLRRRTNLDKKRKNSPLIKVRDAILIRTDKLNKQEVLSKMSKAIDKVIRS